MITTTPQPVTAPQTVTATQSATTAQQSATTAQQSATTSQQSTTTAQAATSSTYPLDKIISAGTGGASTGGLHPWELYVVTGTVGIVAVFMAIILVCAYKRHRRPRVVDPLDYLYRTRTPSYSTFADVTSPPDSASGSPAEGSTPSAPRTPSVVYDSAMPVSVMTYREHTVGSPPDAAFANYGTPKRLRNMQDYDSAASPLN